MASQQKSNGGDHASAGDGYPEYKLFNSLIFKINRLTSLYFKSSSRYYQRHFGMGMPEVRLLNIIGSMPWVGAQEVVEISSMDKGLVSRALANLIKRGYLLKLQDMDDRRRQRLELTPEGRDLYRRIRAAKHERHLRAVSGLTPAECRELYRLLDKAVATAQTMAQEEGVVDSTPATKPTRYPHSWPASGLIDYVPDPPAPAS